MTQSNNPFLLDASAAPKDSNLTDLQDTGTAPENPINDYNPNTTSLEELARADTTHVHELRNRADRVMLVTEKLVIPEASGVREVLDALDSAMSETDRLDYFGLDKVRDYVQALMVTLKQKPELSGMLLDSDIRNVVRYAHQQYRDALDEQDSMADKAAAKARTKAAKGKGASGSAATRKKVDLFKDDDLGGLDL